MDSDSPGSALSRRQFVLAAGAAAGLIACGRSDDLPDLLAPRASDLIVTPDASGIEHIVLVMMENRSFDHFFGWVPGADARQAGLRYPDRQGVLRRTHPLAPDYQGCSHPDPDHSYSGGRVEYNDGRCDGWLLAGENDEYAIGYYRQRDLAFDGHAVPSWTTCDRYFAAIMAETFPNRIYQHAAQTDRLTNTRTISTLPTIWDRLADAGLSGRYYYSDVPFLALWGDKYVSIGRPFASFITDCAAGTLPQVSFVDPRFVDENSGTSGDDHPHADVRTGQTFLNQVYSAVVQSPAWQSTVLVINYDEWGGFFDHVPPPTAPIPNADAAAGNADGLLGFRTPTLIVAPWARRGAVSHTQFDHTSILRMIEWRWGLDPLTVRDASANNLAGALDFKHPSLRAPLFTVPPAAAGTPCPPGSAPVDGDIGALSDLATQSGWAVYSSTAA